MSSHPTPADELRAAATLLRKLADDATPGPWAVDSSIPYGHRVGSSDESDWIAWTGEHGETGSEADAAYLAAMHPAVGLALADWLEYEAGRIERLHGHGAVTYAPAPALAVARALNPPAT